MKERVKKINKCVTSFKDDTWINLCVSGGTLQQFFMEVGAIFIVKKLELWDKDLGISTNIKTLWFCLIFLYKPAMQQMHDNYRANVIPGLLQQYEE